jgi:putative transposase
MRTTPDLYRGFRFPAEIISHAVWLYHCFSLSLREVELILAQCTNGSAGSLSA